MQVILESTTKIVTVDGGIACRVWEGHTAAGVKVAALIPRIAAGEGQDLSQFEAELQEHQPPTADAEAFPLRMIL